MIILKRCWILSAFFLVLFVLNSLGVTTSSVQQVDASILHNVVENRETVFTYLFSFVTLFGDNRVLAVVACSLIFTLFFRKQWAYLFSFLGLLIGTHLLSSQLKLYFARMRPDFIYHLTEANGFSYPSGHSFNSFCLYFFVCMYLSSLTDRSFIKKLYFFITGGLVLSISISRIYLGVHYPSDVLGGIILGVFWLSLVWWTKLKIDQRLN